MQLQWNFRFKNTFFKITGMIGVVVSMALPFQAQAVNSATVQAMPFASSTLPSERLKSGQTFQQLKLSEAGVAAVSADGDDFKPWAGDVELGLVLSSGNTESTAIRANAELLHEMKDFRNKYLIQTLFQRNSQFDRENNSKTSNTTGQRLNLVGQSNYKFHRSEFSIFGRGAYLNDRFGAFREQASIAAGSAMRIYEEGDNYWDIETGPGFAHQETSDGERSTGIIWYAATNLDYQLNEHNSFRQSLEWSVSLDGKNSSWQSRSAFTSQVSGQLSMRLGFLVKYDSNPGEFRSKTDTETSATLVYSF
jgi:putative salt-induced outer membrane protein YdiY